MKVAIFSLGLIALGIIALLTLSPLQEAADTITSLVHRGGLAPRSTELEKAAKQLPRQPAVEIALAQVALLKASQQAKAADEDPKSLPSDLSAFQKAVADFPDSPEAHLQLGLQQLLRAGVPQRPEMWRGAGAPIPAFHPPQPQEADFLGAAIAQLRIAASLAPKNAAPDFLLAAALFYQGNYSAAEASLRAATAKPEWSLYNKDARLALFDLYQRCRVPSFYRPLVIPNLGPTVTNPVYDRVDFLARMLLGLEQKAREAGQEQSALFYAQALLHLSDVVLDGADTVIEGSIGVSLLNLAREPFISRPEIEALQKQYSQKQMLEKVAARRNDNFRAFLLSQGRGDLALLYSSNQQRISDFQNSVTAAAQESLKQEVKTFGRPVVLLAMISLFQAAFVLSLLVPVLLLSLLLWGSRGPGKAPVWRWWEWLLLMLVSFLPAYLVVLILFPPGERTFAALFQHYLTRSQGKALSLATLALLLPFLAPLIGGLLKRPFSEKERIGKFQACLASWRALLLPAFAALFIVALGFGYFAQRQLQPWVAKQNKIIQQGVVNYYKLLPPQ